MQLTSLTDDVTARRAEPGSLSSLIHFDFTINMTLQFAPIAPTVSLFIFTLPTGTSLLYKLRMLYSVEVSFPCRLLHPVEV